MLMPLTPTEEIILLRMPKLPQENPPEFYAYQIAEMINKSAKGRLVITLGTLYPTLRRLEKKGCLTSRWGDETYPANEEAGRKYYQITQSGQQALQWIKKLRDDLIADAGKSNHLMLLKNMNLTA
jgi:PadR family transcriptional regulator, regulatory protein PadR